LASGSNICLTRSAGCARVGSDGGAVAAEEGEDPAFPGAAGVRSSQTAYYHLQKLEEDEAPPDGEVVVALLGDGEEVTVKRHYTERNGVRLRPEDVRVRGRVVYVVHPPGKRA
jgi:hypothetical protein